MGIEYEIVEKWCKNNEDFIVMVCTIFQGFPGNSAGKESTGNARDPSSIGLP